MFSFAQNRFQIFDVDISAFVALKIRQIWRKMLFVDSSRDLTKKSLRIDLFDFFSIVKTL